MYELLAPAGSYEGFMGAISAGADAIYLAGKKFGARAFASNFTDEELIDAINYAHLFGRKVYLTVNTLLKDDEIDDLFDYLLPLYNAKLDGVIIQDIGVISWITRSFPELEVHASTQMGVTGVYGAKYLKGLGVKRVVLARELSLSEIEKIKKEVDIELEVFVHGAMCYSYSGNCLYSSLLGGRSGNRGRCAQPCRLPYSLEENGKDEYLLSLKDMCLLSSIQKLIDIGVDSFKIEGRMKRAEYTAGVTSIYRKYIDSYLSKNDKINVNKNDMDMIKKLYIRSDLSSGYIDKYNSRDMITLMKPSYEEASNELIEDIRKKYIEKNLKINANIEVTIKLNEPINIRVYSEKHGGVVYEGALVQSANKLPLDDMTVRKQMLKIGGSNIIIDKLNIYIDEGCYLTIKELNEARRSAIALFEAKIKGNCEIVKNEVINEYCIQNKIDGSYTKTNTLQIVANKLCHLKAIKGFKEISAVYIESDLFLNDYKEVNKYISKSFDNGCEIYIALPYILREHSYKLLNDLEKYIISDKISGVLVRNYEEIQWLIDIEYNKKCILDSCVYTFNRYAIDYYVNKGYKFIASYELNQREIANMSMAGELYYAYGRIPMMVTANCIYKTKGMCNKSKNDYIHINDRYNKKLPIYLNCNYCYNLVYNSLPMSLHQSFTTFVNKYKMQPILSFTDEDEVTTRHIISYFVSCFDDVAKKANEIGIDYTKGHLKRGVE